MRGRLTRESDEIARWRSGTRQQLAALLDSARMDLEHVRARVRALSPQATLERGYAIVRTDDAIVRNGSALEPGARVDVELAEGGFGARVEDTR